MTNMIPMLRKLRKVEADNLVKTSHLASAATGTGHRNTMNEAERAIPTEKSSVLEHGIFAKQRVHVVSAEPVHRRSRARHTCVLPNHRVEPSSVSYHALDRYLSLSVAMQSSELMYLPVQQLYLWAKSLVVGFKGTLSFCCRAGQWTDVLSS
jgi:hypothetical protein